MSKKPRNISIPNPQVSFINKKITYSFEYYDTSHKYCISAWDKEQIKLALCRLREINQKSYNELYQQRITFHFHEVDWNETNEKRGFPTLPSNQFPAYQLALLNVNRQKCRVFGAFSQGIFYIVWFDLNHQVDPSMKR